MFQNCSNLRTLHIGEMDLSSAKNFSRMFSGCSSLETIDGTFVNGNVVEDLNTMFTGCRQLQKDKQQLFSSLELFYKVFYLEDY